MLRPDRMSKVSITGSKAVMPAVIETIHDLNLVHISDYDGSWEGFDNGTPLEGSEETSEKLVTVRSIESKLGLRDDDRVVSIEDFDEETYDNRLEDIRSTVNELDDRRKDLQDQRRVLSDRIDTLEPFAELGIDLDLLSGYDNIEIVAGRGRPDAVESELANASEIEHYETFSADDLIVIAAPYDVDQITGALVGVEFTQVEVPDENGDPSAKLASLQEERAEIKGQIEEIDAELETVREDVDEFILQTEQYLTAKVQQTDIPLQFATTKRSFIAEGWIPSGDLEDLRADLDAAVGDRVDIEEISRADYAEDNHSTSEEAVADGGTVQTMDETPPTKMKNPGPARPFEKLVQVMNQPKYSELDPTMIVFLTFPIAFGFMISDIAYGFLYIAMGYALWQFRSEMLHALGSIAVWCGAFTALFGVFYDDFFGMSTGIDLPIVGFINKGYEPYIEDPGFFVELWIVVAIVFGVLHMSTAFILKFINERPHGLKHAALESISWLIALVGLYVWVFSEHLVGNKPDFIAGEDAVYADFVPTIIETGFPAEVGLIGLGLFVVGTIGIYLGEGILGVIEIPTQILGHSLSYLRIPAVLLAKGGMALVVLIVTDLLLFDATAEVINTEEGGGTMSLADAFVGGDIVNLLPDTGILLAIPLVILAIIVFVIGHIIVLLLGITAAGIQMLRLEYVEFFQKFYEGGGEKYQPFGLDHSSNED